MGIEPTTLSLPMKSSTTELSQRVSHSKTNPKFNQGHMLITLNMPAYALRQMEVRARLELATATL